MLCPSVRQLVRWSVGPSVSMNRKVGKQVFLKLFVYVSVLEGPFLETEEFVIYSYINNPFLLLHILLLSGWNFSDRELLRGPLSVRLLRVSPGYFCLSIPALGEETVRTEDDGG